MEPIDFKSLPFGEKIRKAREIIGRHEKPNAKPISAEEMSRRLNCSRLTVVNYENGGNPLNSILDTFNSEIEPMVCKYLENEVADDGNDPVFPTGDPIDAALDA